MTQDEIIEMARQAGAAVGKPTPDGPNIVFTQCLDVYAFAKLVADVATAKEREACANVCDKASAVSLPAFLAMQIRARGEA